MGSDATVGNCAEVDHTHRIFTGFQASLRSDFRSALTGLPRGYY